MVNIDFYTSDLNCLSHADRLDWKTCPNLTFNLVKLTWSVMSFGTMDSSYGIS